MLSTEDPCCAGSCSNSPSKFGRHSRPLGKFGASSSSCQSLARQSSGPATRSSVAKGLDCHGAQSGGRLGSQQNEQVPEEEHGKDKSQEALRRLCEVPQIHCQLRPSSEHSLGSAVLSFAFSSLVVLHDLDKIRPDTIFLPVVLVGVL